MIPDPAFPEIVTHFDFEGSFLRAEPYGFGHINDTYAAYFQKPDGELHRYLMQRINHRVFRHPDKLMDNIAAVTAHLHRKIIIAGGDPNREALTIIPTREGSAFHKTEAGCYWRAYIFIEKARTYEVAGCLDHVCNAAYAFGRFQQLLTDFPADRLHETIVNFHDTAKRFEAFFQVVAADPCNRAKEVEGAIGFVMQRAGETKVLVGLIAAGRLPVRVTHNDTKFNNVMIDDLTGKGVCVIDLDTVMPGSLLYDFGDAIRSIANTSEEDQRDLSKVHFNIEIFETFVRGYLSALQGALTATEIEHLAFSARLMTLECGMRFLADHLAGDIYFRTKRRDHNLDRCRTQFKLVQEMEENYDRMLRIIKNVAEYRWQGA